MSKNLILSEVKQGKSFKIGDFEFIKFLDENGETVAVSKNIVFNSSFGKNNDFSESNILEKLTNEVLSEIEKAVGAENVLEFETDLRTLDGLKPYKPLKSKISIPTFDFYRNNVEIFDEHKLDEWWWLATPDSAEPHYNPTWAVCVAPSGYISINRYDYSYGVRPILRFVSAIFVSCDD